MKRGGRIIRVQPERTQLGPFLPDVPLVYNVSDAEGQAILFPAAYDRYLRLIDDYGDYALATNTAPPLAQPAMVSSPLSRLLDVRTVIVSSDTRIPRGINVLTDGPIRAYGVTSYGAAQIVPEALPATNEAMWRNLVRPDWAPLTTASVVGLRRRMRGSTGRAVLQSRDATSERWHVSAQAGGLLRISGNYFGGWTAREDGRPVPVYRADGIFRAVVVSPGRHEVVLTYRNPSEARGRWLGLVGLAAIVALLAPWGGRRRVVMRPRA
jgi:ribosomal protein L34